MLSVMTVLDATDHKEMKITTAAMGTRTYFAMPFNCSLTSSPAIRRMEGFQDGKSRHVAKLQCFTAPIHSDSVSIDQERES